MKGIAKILILDKLTKNGHIFSRPVFEVAIKDYWKLISEGKALGELSPYPGMGILSTVIDLSNVSHQITNLEIRGDEVVAEIYILNTPRGKLLQSMLATSDPLKISFRNRGTGKMNPDHTIENYSLIAIDAILPPAATPL